MTLSPIGESRATTTTPENKCSGLWATTRTKGRQAFTAIVRALKASQALGKAALTGRGEIPARLCCQPPDESLFLHNVQAGAHILLYADRKGE